MHFTELEVLPKRSRRWSSKLIIFQARIQLSRTRFSTGPIKIYGASVANQVGGSGHRQASIYERRVVRVCQLEHHYQRSH